MCLDFQDGDLVQQLAPGDGNQWRGHRGSACAIAANTGAQSPSRLWRNSRIDGYQGLSARSSIQRQSGTCRSATQVGRPSAPARCAMEVSDVTIRSSAIITAAVSMNASG